MSKMAAQITTTERKTYVQKNFIGGGITLDDLRDLVAATEDYDAGSHVTLTASNITITETKSSGWSHAGRKPQKEDDDGER